MGEQDHALGEGQPQSVRVSGRVKWFNAAKGFGFVAAEDESGDVFIHLSALRQAGYEGVEQGATVTCDAVRGPKGLQAIRIVEVDTSTSLPSGGPAGRREPPDDRHPSLAAEGEFFSAVVKWFNAEKGYGFVTRGEGTQDIFVHIKTLRAVGIEDLNPGQVLRVRTGRGPKGPQVAEIDAD
jgi:CspA family cold shock protein